MKILLLVFLLMAVYVSHAQENQDFERKDSISQNTLEVKGFSVPIEEVSDSLSILMDSLTLKEEKKISRIDSLVFLAFQLPKPGILKNVVWTPYPKYQTPY